jgi:hypothetical protein
LPHALAGYALLLAVAFTMRSVGAVVGVMVRSPDAVGRAVEMIDARRRLMEEKLAALHAIEPDAAAGASSDPFPYLVLRYGLESSGGGIAWWERARAELATARPSQR